MSLQNAADNYFGSLNSIAKRMHEDMNETKASYEALWSELSREEKDQIFNESIIKPEASLRYASVAPAKPQRVSEYAIKTIVDEGCRFRDEHSAPFSFRTSSQRDLRLFGATKDLAKVPKACDALRVFWGTLFQMCPSSKTCSSNITISEDDIKVEMEKDTSSSTVSTLPKTGLDFLDNW